MERTLHQKMASVVLAIALVLGGGLLVGVAQEATEAQPAFAAQKGTWKTTSGKWWYAYSDGSYAKSGWVAINGTWYLFDNAGWMKTGWQQVGSKWYHLNGSGVMSAKKWIGDYYVEASGAMATNKWIGNYYVGADGKWDRSKGSGQTNSATVYWVSSGKVYHTTKDCPSLSRSKNIQSGTVAQSGKPRVCSNCG